jgi:hypothetical protein
MGDVSDHFRTQPERHPLAEADGEVRVLLGFARAAISAADILGEWMLN